MKYRNKHLFLILAFSLNCFNLICQDTIKLTQIGESYLSKIIGSRYFNLESENINLQQIKSLKDLKVSSFKKATIAEINNLKLRSNSSFKSKYHTHPNFFKNKLMKLFNHW